MGKKWWRRWWPKVTSCRGVLRDPQVELVRSKSTGSGGQDGGGGGGGVVAEV